MKFKNIWLLLLVISIVDDAFSGDYPVFCFEFNLRPSSIKNQIDSIKDKFAPDYDADEDFRSRQRTERRTSFENLKVTSEVEAPKQKLLKPLKP